MKYLVTGGLGFIGSHLVERLLKEKGSKVVVIDDFSEGKRSNLPRNKRLKICKASIMDPDIDKYFNVDVVFHLAALTRPQWSILNPVEATRVNVGGTIHVLNHCRDHKVKRVAFVSSSSIYGEQLVQPTLESSPINPMSPYALNKYEGELFAKLYNILYNLQVNSIRPFNVYGTRQGADSPYSAAVPKFIDTLRKGGTPYITGDGEQTRDYVYIDDVVEIIYLASKCKEYGEAFNAGSGRNVSINNLYKLICKIMGKEVTPDYVAKVVEPTLTLADMSKVKQLLNFEPKIDLEEGLRRTINENPSIR